MSQIEGLVDVAVKIGAFSHEMQKEPRHDRGLGQQGDKFKNELPSNSAKQPTRVWRHCRRCCACLDRSSYPIEVMQALDKALNAVKGLPGVRDDVSQLNISPAKAIGYYTDTVELLLGVGRQAKMLAPNERLARHLVTDLNFSFGKERAGVERAVLTNVFAADKFNPEALARFLRNAAAQDVYLHEFEVTAYSHQVEMYQRKVVGHEVDEAARMKHCARWIDGRSLGVDANHWFAWSPPDQSFKEVEGIWPRMFWNQCSYLRGCAALAYLFLLLAIVALVATTLLAFIT
jgi:methyl-accepting chemotaxis protein